MIDRSLCEIGDRKSPIFMDDDVIGFGLPVRETGRKSFTLDYTFEGRRRRLFIGGFPEWSTVAAREQAKPVKREVGHDLLHQRSLLLIEWLHRHVGLLLPDVGRVADTLCSARSAIHC